MPASLLFRFRNCPPWMFGVVAFAALWIVRQGGLTALELAASRPTVAICCDTAVPDAVASGVARFAQQRLVSRTAVQRALKTITMRTGMKENAEVDTLAKGLTCELCSENAEDRWVVLSYSGSSSIGTELVEELARQFVVGDLVRLDQSLSDRVALHRQQITHLQANHPRLELAIQKVTRQSSILQAAVRQARVERASFRFASNVAAERLGSVASRRHDLGGQLVAALGERSRLLEQIDLERRQADQLQQEISHLNRFREEVGAVAWRVERIRYHYFTATLFIAELVCLLGITWWAMYASVLPSRLSDALVKPSKQARNVLAIPVLACYVKRVRC